MAADTTPPVTPEPHKCRFPVQPPHGSFFAPGPCQTCGKTYAQNEADTLFADALKALEAAYGVPPRLSTHWAVAFGSGGLNDSQGYVELYDDEEDARDHLSQYEGGSVVRRTVVSLRWEAVPGVDPDEVTRLEEVLAGGNGAERESS